MKWNDRRSLLVLNEASHSNILCLDSILRLGSARQGIIIRTIRDIFSCQNWGPLKLKEADYISIQSKGRQSRVLQGIIYQRYRVSLYFDHPANTLNKPTVITRALIFSISLVRIL